MVMYINKHCMKMDYQRIRAEKTLEIQTGIKNKANDVSFHLIHIMVMLR